MPRSRSWFRLRVERLLFITAGTAKAIVHELFIPLLFISCFTRALYLYPATIFCSYVQIQSRPRRIGMVPPEQPCC